MLSSRARSRFAVLATAAPLLAGGVLVSPAIAASVSVAPYTSIGANNVVGPNAGFRNVAQGVRGNTAVLTLDVSSASASLDRVDVKLSGFPTGPAIVPDRDFAQTDGFAVFKDVSQGPNNTIAGPDGVFGVLDHAQGPVSTGYLVGTPSSGQYPVRIVIDGLRATNSTRYFLTVHPGDAGGSIENRDFVVTLPVDGVRFGDATTSPAAAVATPRLTIDSKPPITPAAGNFSPQSQPPMERQASPAKEDGYLVSKNEDNDPDKTLIFLNDGNNTAPANFIYRPVPQGSDPLPAIYDAPSADTTLFIGDGTGITPTQKVARNNQLSDDVYVRGFDTLGNLTPAVRLFNAFLADTGDKQDRSNDVTAPVVSATSAGLRTAAPAARGVTAANVAAVPTRIAFTAGQANATRDTHNRASLVEARMVLVVGGVQSTNPADATPWASALPAPTSTSAQGIQVPVNTTGVGTTGSQLRVEGRLLDDLRNETDIWRSAALFPKDLVTPRVTAAFFDFDDDGDNQGDMDDRIRIRWSEPMFKASIAETGENNPCRPVAPTPELDQGCVVTRILFPDGGITWGSNPTVVWSADLTSVLITLGPTTSGAELRFPQLGDKIRSTENVQDPAGNPAAIPSHSDFFISQPAPIASLVTTADTPGVGRNLYSQGRDGYLDKVTVTFPVAITDAATAFPANKDNFKIIGSDVQVPTAATFVSTSQLTLSFGGVMGTGERPQVVYTPPATGGLKSGGLDVPAFTVTALDKAPPAVQLVTTQDANADGKLDSLVATYSEPINHDILEGEPPESYYVSGYEDSPDGELGCPAQGLPIMDPYNSSQAGPTPNVTIINLCPKTTHDTAATPSASAAVHVTDLADNGDDAGPNVSSNGWSTGVNDTVSVFNRMLDKAPPVVVSRTTKDLNSDGRIDAIDIVYGEVLDGVTIEGAQFSVSNRTVSSVDLLTGSSVRLSLTPIPQGLAGDTDSKPTVQYTGSPTGGIRDASDQRNAVRPDAAPVATTDGAGPAITGACAGTPANNGKCPLDTSANDFMNVFFSEPLATASDDAVDFVVEQPAGTNKAITAYALAADGKSAQLTFANNAINPALDALVRFTAAGAVTDASTPAQGNTQTASVVAPAPPAVALNLTCPIPAGAGFCGAAFVNTGAVGTAGLVRLWRLSTTARSATPPDSEFSTTQPAIYPPTGSAPLPEGTLTLYLSGKDDFGRLSTEVSQSIKILKAPFIQNVQYVNTTQLTAAQAAVRWGRTDTVVDGDTIRVGATAFGTDAAEWASAGGCLGANMSVDYRSITGVTNQGAVAPFTCNLNTATAPDSRAMVFPYVKASGTTHFPVGTVLKLTANDPGALIVDGPNGTQLRRHFISVNARRSHQIPDAHVITVPVSVMNGIKRGSGMGYRDGAIIKTSTSGYYYMYQNIKRPISGATLTAWRIPTSQVYLVSAAEFKAHGTGVGLKPGSHAVGTWIRFSNGSISQIVRNAQGVVVRRGISSTLALNTLVPSGQIYPAVSQDAAIPFDTTWLRGLRDGTLVRTGTNTYAVVARGVLRHFANTKTMNTMGYNAANARTFSSSQMPRPYGGSYLTGSAIDRYKITSLIIKVTNKAGGVATATVLPQLGGHIFGVGNLDPVPANWDFTR